MRSVLVYLIGLKLIALLTLSSVAWAQASSSGSSDKLQASKDMGEVATSKEADLKTARLHFSNGVALLQETPPNYQDAWQQFRLALTKSGDSWKVRGNLGYCALKLERDGEALQQYRLYLKEGGDEIDPKERADIERELLLLEGNMSWVTITSSSPEVELGVTRSGSSSPPQAYALSGGEAKLGLRAGSFTITATAGDQTLLWEPLLTPGKQTTHHFDFNAAATNSDAQAQAAAQNGAEPQGQGRPAHGPSTLQVIGYASLGVGVLAAGTGIVTGVMAKSKEKQAKEDCVDGTCPESDLSKKKSAQGLATATNILFITGGVLAATGITLVIVGKPPKSKEVAQRTLELSPGVEWGGGSLFLSGTY